MFMPLLDLIIFIYSDVFSMKLSICVVVAVVVVVLLLLLLLTTSERMQFEWWKN